MAKKQTFESAMERIEEISRRLEQGETSIEEALTLYEEGAKLLKYCSGILEKAEQKVALIRKDSEDQPKEEPFDA